jgi:ribonuclease HII
MIIVGIDEAGRGALVGNVVASAVILPKDFYLAGLTDSKKLNATKREYLYKVISQKCKWAIGEATNIEIDKINILQASLLAMERAVKNLNTRYDNALVDGIHCPNINNCKAIVKGDLTEPVISAASIVAKVTRDKQMLLLDKTYPEYNFSKHKGYATKNHIKAISDFGYTKFHRKSFAPIKDFKSR